MRGREGARDEERGEGWEGGEGKGGDGDGREQREGRGGRDREGGEGKGGVERERRRARDPVPFQKMVSARRILSSTEYLISPGLSIIAMRQNTHLSASSNK